MQIYLEYKYIKKIVNGFNFSCMRIFKARAHVSVNRFKNDRSNNLSDGPTNFKDVFRI